MREKKRLLRFIISVSIPLLAGFIGSFFTTPNIEPWYDLLNKPPLTPPGSLIGIVWTILYILIGIALFMVWEKREKRKGLNEDKKKAFWIFGIQITLNSMWSMFFFGLRNSWLGLMIIIPLLITIIINIIFFYKIDKKAAYLMVPYLIWVSFATYLNIGLAILN